MIEGGTEVIVHYNRLKPFLSLVPKTGNQVVTVAAHYVPLCPEVSNSSAGSFGKLHVPLGGLERVRPSNQPFWNVGRDTGPIPVSTLKPKHWTLMDLIDVTCVRSCSAWVWVHEGLKCYKNDKWGTLSWRKFVAWIQHHAIGRSFCI